MQRLLDDAEKISGIKYDISSFADVTEAIHVMQEQMGIAGTTSKEAASTISGSVGMVKAAWENFLTGMADPGQDFGELVGGLTDSIGIALENIVPRLVQALPRLIQGLAQVIQTLVGYLPQILGALLPGLVTGATELLGALGATLPSLFMTLFDQVLPQISQAFVAFLEKVFSVPEGSFQGLTDGLNLAFATISSIFDVLFGSLSEKDNIDLLTKLGMDSGTAETIITTTTQIGDTIKSSFETAVDIVTEGADKVADFISWFEKGGPTVDAFKAAIVGITTAWAGYKVVTGTIQAIETVRNTLLAVGNGFMLARSVQSGVLTAAEATQAAATMGASGAFGIFNAVLSANPIAIVIMAITALVAALVWFFTQTETGKQAWSSFMSFLTGVWNNIVSSGQAIWTSLSTFFTFILNAIFNTFSSIWSRITSLISNAVSGIYNSVTSTFQNVWTTVANIWNGIKDTISNAINGAKDTVSRAIEGIKGLFNFSWKLPDIKLPHFNVSGGEPPFGMMGKGSLPRIGVEWYAKGGIMNGPTVFGMNGNNVMVGGEAGKEAILPLNDKTLGAIGRGIAQTMGGSAPAINITITGNVVREEADITKIANQVAQRIADELQRKTQLKGGPA